MRKVTTWLALVCIGVLCANAQTIRRSPGAAGVVQLETRLQQGVSKGDVNELSRSFSELYSDAGRSKEDALRQFSKTFAADQRGAVQVRITDLKQFRGTDVASARIHIQSRTAGQDLVGFANLIREGGEWKIFGINAFERNQLSEGNTMFACPDPGAAFNFDQEMGDWPGWPAAKVERVSYRQGPEFRKAEWERRVISAWNSKSVKQVSDYLSNRYVHLGASKDEVVKGAAELFRNYDQISMRFRVIDFKYLTNRRNLVSYKAVMEVTGVPVSGKQPITVLKTMGYGNLVYEGGTWKQYSTQFYR